MEPWTFDKYVEPRLVHADIHVLSERLLSLTAHDEEFEIEVEPPLKIDDIQSGLSSLLSPNSTIWRRLTTDEEVASIWRPIIQRLDECGLIVGAGGTTNVDSGLDDIERAIASASDFFVREAERNGLLVPTLQCSRTIFQAAARRYLATSAWSELTACYHSGTESVAINPFDEKDFYLLTLRLQVTSWAFGSPASIFACCELLDRTLYLLQARDTSYSNESKSTALITRLLLAGYSKIAVLEHLNCLHRILLSAGHESSKRIRHTSESIPEQCCGMELALLGEREALRCLRELGPSKYTRNVTAGSVSRSVVLGTYVQEYHVTKRFVEIIAPMLSKQLRPSLRRRMFRYYEEEVGHERFERDTCLSLGVQSAELDETFPLPLHTAFVDIFTLCALQEPVAYLLSIFVTEGLFGAPSDVNERLADHVDSMRFREVSRRHERLNDELNHPSLTRLALNDIQSVDSSSIRRAIDFLRYFVELNWRAWEDLFAYYSTAEHSLAYRGFERIAEK